MDVHVGEARHEKGALPLHDLRVGRHLNAIRGSEGGDRISLRDHGLVAQDPIAVHGDDGHMGERNRGRLVFRGTGWARVTTACP